ncbi:hypothetical protein AMEX_G7398 [Astyanax mexicanus]|uniref:Uncharacterized protein n=1 Tax=Astyanax mexicanus TaxID=7994 RepID=A0A8T2LZE7_ASTMX|nr:hypothetical protein AMEX_G7398 [Astyanax mexicanus]
MTLFSVLRILPFVFALIGFVVISDCLSGFGSWTVFTTTSPVYTTPKEDPWSRLSETPTFSSKRRSVYSDDNPIDSLDLKLTSVYDQSKDFLSSKNKVVLQSETLGIKPEELQEPEALQEEPCRLPRCTSYETPHTIQSAHGYSRKHDGGFYSYVSPEK